MSTIAEEHPLPRLGASSSFDEAELAVMVELIRAAKGEQIEIRALSRTPAFVLLVHKFYQMRCTCNRQRHLRALALQEREQKREGDRGIPGRT